MAARLLSRGSVFSVARRTHLPRSALTSVAARSLFQSAPNRTESASLDSTLPTFSSSTNYGFTSKMNFVDSLATMEAYRVMTPEGKLLDPNHQPADLSPEKVKHLYKIMVQLNTMDQIMYEAQRQGRFSFYMTHYGEEALLGVAAALDATDIVHGQYREAYTLLYRGYTMEECMDQCFANVADGGKGRQMPVHYTSQEHHFQSISSPLATQIPQAAGSAYALKREGSGDRCSVCFFGEGAASEGDFHAGMNMASTLRCPVIFVCRNNGYAISTPASEQYKGDGIASRGVGYGMDTIRIDGNDIWAAYNATKAARQISTRENKPVLIEAMTYRVGHHSTSDDSTKYRDRKEVDHYHTMDNPITRLRRYMEVQGYWTQEQETELKAHTKKEVMDTFKRSEKKKKPAVEEMFTDVYDELPPNLVKQRDELIRLVNEYPEYYNADDHEKMFSH